MANIQKFIPFLIFWETSVKDASLDNESLFLKARKKGIVHDAYDRGGATIVGITIGTYGDYCRKCGRANPTVSSLNSLTYAEWIDIFKTMFWNRWQADKITDQRVAEMLVDWIWTSGVYGITVPQRVLGVKTDGIVGTETLAAINSQDPEKFFKLLKRERAAYINHICTSRPAYRRFKKGWLSRINAL